MEALQLSFLPDLPQQDTIGEVARALWQRQEVIALWLGGSLACGTADMYSDIDLRVAVAPSHLTVWEAPAFERLFVRSSVRGQQFLRFADDAFLHHLLLSTGELVDLHIQRADAEVSAEPHLVLGCRSDLFAHKLAQSQRASPIMEPRLPEREALQRLFIDFWINTHKHRKVLHRNLDLLCIRRIQLERDLLLRLWYIQVSGRDYGAMRETLHSLTEIVHTVEAANVPRARRILRAPLRTHRELMQAIEMNRDAVSELGRHLARQYGFEYPAELEATALQSWRNFVRSSAVSAEATRSAGIGQERR